MRHKVGDCKDFIWECLELGQGVDSWQILTKNSTVAGWKFHLTVIYQHISALFIKPFTQSCEKLKV